MSVCIVSIIHPIQLIEILQKSDSENIISNNKLNLYNIFKARSAACLPKYEE